MRKSPALATLSGAALLGVVLSSCAAQPEPPSYDEPVNLTMTVWTGDENVMNAYQELAAEFRADNPELGELTIQSLPFAEYVAQLTIQLNGGDAPDLGWIVDSTIPAWVDSGALADISALKDDPEWDFDDIIRPLDELTGPDGELLGYPFANTTHPIIVNTTVFEQAGVDSPLELLERGEWTWENLKRISAEIVASEAVTYGFDIPQFSYTSYNLFNPIGLGFGAHAFPGGDTCGLTSDEYTEAVEFLREMIFEDNSFPAPGSASSFPTGDTAMLLQAPSFLSQLADSDFAFDLVPQPEGDVPYDPFLGEAAIVVFNAGETPELATRLLGYFTSPHGVETLAPFYVTPRTSALTPERVALVNAALTPDAAERSLITPLQSAKPIDFPIAYPEIEATIKPILDALWVPGADVESVLADACAAAEPLL